MTDKTTTNMTQSEIIEKCSQIDLAAYNNGKKSFKLWNWLKDELLLQAIAQNKKAKLDITCKALGRIVSVLGRLREGDLVIDCKVEIKDAETAIVTCKVELDNLTNIERRRLNSEYGTTLPMRDEEEVYDEFDQTAWH